MNITGGWLDLEVRMGDSGSWAGLQMASSTAVTLSGWVTATNGTGIANAGVDLWDQSTETGSWGNTDADGYYKLVVEPGVYMFNGWPDFNSGLGGFMINSYNITSDTVYNLTLTARAQFSFIQLNPQTARLGETIIASFNITAQDGGTPLTGVSDGSFSVWLHNWGAEPPGSNWWENPTSTQYHQDISDDVTVAEGVAGSYSFSFVVPSAMNITGGWMDLEVRMGDSGGWAGLMMASSSAVQLSGWVTLSNGTGLANVGVDLFNPSTEQGSFANTNASGYYKLVVEPAVFMLNVFPPQGLSGLFVAGYNLTSDTVYNVTLMARAEISELNISPNSLIVNETATVTFNVEDDSGDPMSGISDSSFTVWLHNWGAEPPGSNWWSTQESNQYHQDISGSVNVLEGVAGSYNFTFAVPSTINITGGFIDMQIRLGNSESWMGVQMGSNTAVALSGYVALPNGTSIDGIDVILFHPATEIDFFTMTDQNGYYKIYAEPGLYLVVIPALDGEDCEEENEEDCEEEGEENMPSTAYRRYMTLTADTTWNITLIYPPIFLVQPNQFGLSPYDPTTTVTVTFVAVDMNQNPVSGLTDSNFDIWVHNMQHFQAWMANPVSNSNHQNMTIRITVTEISAGLYSFTLTIPEGMNVSLNQMGLFIDLVMYGGVVSSLQIPLPLI